MAVHIWDLALDTVMGKIVIEPVCKQQINIRMKVFEWRHYGGRTSFWITRFL